MPGSLLVIATPIGNLGDISYRAVRELQSADLILAEDTRKFRILAQEYRIETHVKSYHQQNEKQSVENIISLLHAGNKIALVSEAGTPCISDPGYRLIRAARDTNITVCSIPGACAAIAALSISGLPCHQFVFEGFLPLKPGKRRQALQQALERDITTIFYESPHRILKMLTTLSELAPTRMISIGRELTKLYEEMLSGTAQTLKEHLETQRKVRGEFTVILGTTEFSTRLPIPTRELA